MRAPGPREEMDIANQFHVGHHQPPQGNKVWTLTAQAWLVTGGLEVGLCNPLTSTVPFHSSLSVPAWKGSVTEPAAPCLSSQAFSSTALLLSTVPEAAFVAGRKRMPVALANAASARADCKTPPWRPAANTSH